MTRLGQPALPAQTVAIDPLEVQYVIVHLNHVLQAVQSDWLRDVIDKARTRVIGLKPVKNLPSTAMVQFSLNSPVADSLLFA
jgi:hypothetical protein